MDHHTHKRQQERERIRARREALALRFQRRRQRYVKRQIVLYTYLLVLVLCVIGGGIALVYYGTHDYVLLSGKERETVRLYPGSPEAAVHRSRFAGLTITDVRKQDRVSYVTLKPSYSAAIMGRDSGLIVSFTPCTVQELLEAHGITLGKDDIVQPALDTWLDRDTDITITRVTHEVQYEDEPLPFTLVTRQTDKLLEGRERIVQYGQDGVVRVAYTVTLHDGKEVARERGEQTLVTVPRNSIVERGTRQPTTEMEKREADKPLVENATTTALTPTEQMDKAVQAAQSSVTIPTDEQGLSTAGRTKVWSVPAGITDDTENKIITAADGSRFSYSAVIDVTATAYNRVENGGLITATGTTTDYGTVAVDPRVIPLGAQMYIVSNGGDQSWSYGPGIAEDTGGLIKGSRIDLFFMTSAEAIEFGVRPAKIYLLTD